ncbi:MAG: hypothetical protein C4346_18915 [Chloroflexota bacterium]
MEIAANLPLPERALRRFLKQADDHHLPVVPDELLRVTTLKDGYAVRICIICPISASFLC